MDISVYSLESLADGDIKDLISQHKSFVIENIARRNMPEVVQAVEKVIDSEGLKCRVYTKGRVAAIAAELVVPVVGWAAAVAMGAHNIATWNPDYELAKNLLTGSLTINYKKKT